MNKYHPLGFLFHIYPKLGPVRQNRIRVRRVAMVDL